MRKVPIIISQKCNQTLAKQELKVRIGHYVPHKHNTLKIHKQMHTGVPALTHFGQVSMEIQSVCA